MSDIFVVMAAVGEYSDHSEWLIVAYNDERLALLHAERAQRQADADRRLVSEVAMHRDDDPFVSFTGDDGVLLTSPWDPDPLVPSDDFRRRHRYHEAVRGFSPIVYSVERIAVAGEVPAGDVIARVLPEPPPPPPTSPPRYAFSYAQTTDADVFEVMCGCGQPVGRVERSVATPVSLRCAACGNENPVPWRLRRDRC